MVPNAPWPKFRFSPKLVERGMYCCAFGKPAAICSHFGDVHQFGISAFACAEVTGAAQAQSRATGNLHFAASSSAIYLVRTTASLPLLFRTPSIQKKAGPSKWKGVRSHRPQSVPLSKGKSVRVRLRSDFSSSAPDFLPRGKADNRIELLLVLIREYMNANTNGQNLRGKGVGGSAEGSNGEQVGTCATS